MVGLHLTFNPRTNGHSYQIQKTDFEFMENWLLSMPEFKEGRIGIVEERPEKDDAHLHAIFEGPDIIAKGRNKSQETETWFRNNAYGDFPSGWKTGTTAVKVKPMLGAQNINMMMSGYLEKEAFLVHYKQGFDEEELNESKEKYTLKKASSRRENLVETTYMEKALEYRKQKGLETTRLAAVLAHMCNNGYSINYLTRKRKISLEERHLFSKQCVGELTEQDVEDAVFSDPTPVPISPRILNKMNEAVFSGPRTESMN